jgi:hypothetical protein
VTVAYVGSAFATHDGTVTSGSVSYAPTAGNTVILYCNVDATTATSAQTNLGASGTQITTLNNGSNSNFYAFLFANVASGITSFSVTENTFSSGTVWVVEYSGSNGTVTAFNTANSVSFGTAQVIPAISTSLAAGSGLSFGCSSYGGGGTSGHSWTSITGGYTGPVSAYTGGTSGTGAVGMMLYQNNVSGAISAGSYATNTSSMQAGILIALAPVPSGATLAASVFTYSYSLQSVTFAVSAFPPNLLAAAINYNYTLAQASSDFQLTAQGLVYGYTLENAQLVAVASPVNMTAATIYYSIAPQNAQLTLFIPPVGSFPSVVGQYYWVATLMMQQAGVLNPATIGYFGTDPITLVWQKSSFPGGVVLAQVPSAGTVGFKTNSPITLTVSEFAVGASYPAGGTLTGGVA